MPVHNVRAPSIKTWLVAADQGVEATSEFCYSRPERMPSRGERSGMLCKLLHVLLHGQGETMVSRPQEERVQRQSQRKTAEGLVMRDPPWTKISSLSNVSDFRLPVWCLWPSINFISG